MFVICRPKIQLAFYPLPEFADLSGRFAVGRELGDTETNSERVCQGAHLCKRAAASIGFVRLFWVARAIVCIDVAFPYALSPD